MTVGAEALPTQENRDEASQSQASDFETSFADSETLQPGPHNAETLTREEVIERHSGLSIELNGEVMSLADIMRVCKHVRELGTPELDNVLSKVAHDQIRKQQNAELPEETRKAALAARVERLAKRMEAQEAARKAAELQTPVETPNKDAADKNNLSKVKEPSKDKIANLPPLKTPSVAASAETTPNPIAQTTHPKVAIGRQDKITALEIDRITNNHDYIAESEKHEGFNAKEKTKHPKPERVRLAAKKVEAIAPAANPKTEDVPKIAKEQEPQEPTHDIAEWEHELGITPVDKLYITPDSEHVINQITQAENTEDVDDIYAIDRTVDQQFAFDPELETSMAETVLEEVTEVEEPAEIDMEPQLTPEDLLLLAEWETYMKDAEPEDFAEATSTDIVEELIGGPADEPSETLIDILPQPATIEMAETAGNMLQLPAVEPESPAEAVPAVTLAIEQITERIDVLEPEITAKTHALLAEVSDALQTIEELIAATAVPTETETTTADSSPDNTEELQAAEAALALSLTKLCDKLGLDYSQEQISLIVMQLLHQQEQTLILDGIDITNGAETSVDLDNSGIGTHETLSWFLSSIKQLKKQTNWLHRFIGKHALSSFSDLLAIQ